MPCIQCSQKRLHNAQAGGNGKRNEFSIYSSEPFQMFCCIFSQGSVAEKLSMCQWLRFIPHESIKAHWKLQKSSLEASSVMR